MTAAVDRTFAALELLSAHPKGLPVQTVALSLAIVPSAAHRLLNDLVRLGYASQSPDHGTYALTLRLAAIGLSWLGRSGILDVAQPVLDALALRSGELVRLSVADGDRLIWVAVAQGAVSGLRYDPAREQGQVASLAYSASGRAWAATLPVDRALSLIAHQGLSPPDGSGVEVGLTLTQVQEILGHARNTGHAEAVDCFLAGMAAVAIPLPCGGISPGCLSIAGPAARLTPARRAALLPDLRNAAAELMALAPASGLLRGRASR